MKNNNIVKRILESKDTRTFLYRNKIIFSFTPHIGNYEIKDAYFCEVVSFFIYMKRMGYNGNRTDYIYTTLAQLRYNNPHIGTFEELYEIFKNWIVNWFGNSKLFNSEFSIPGDIEKCIMTNPKDLIFYKLGKIKSEWAPLQIESIMPSYVRVRKRNALRTEVNKEMYESDFQEVADEFSDKYWGLKPNAEYLIINTLHKKSSIYKHGKEFYVGRKEYAKQFIMLYRKKYPELTQKKLISRLTSETPLKKLAFSTFTAHLKEIKPQ